MSKEIGPEIFDNEKLAISFTPQDYANMLAPAQTTVTDTTQLLLGTLRSCLESYGSISLEVFQAVTEEFKEKP